MKISKKFSEEKQIYNNIFNIFGIYVIIFAITMVIAGGDGLYIGLFAIGFVLIEYFIFKVFAKFDNLINKISVSDNSIEITYIQQNKIKCEKFDLEELNIQAEISTALYTHSFYYSMHPQAHITLSITLKNGELYTIEDNSDDIDHSLKLLKFLLQLNCFSYKTDSSIFENPNISANIKYAVENYLTQGIYNKKAFKFYQRLFGKIIGVTCFTFIFFLFALVLTIFGLEMAFHIVL